MTERITSRLAAWWNEFCFAPLSPTRLGVARLLYYLGLYWVWFERPSILNPNYASSGLPDEFFFPQNVFRYIPMASADQLGMLTVLLKIALLLAAVGLLTRISTALVFGLVFYLMSVPEMWGRVVIINAIPVMVTGLLALSRCGDAVSIDRLIRDRWKHWPLTAPEPTPSGHYRWPLQLIGTYLTMTLCLAAFSKLINSGPAWFLSDNLSLLLRTTLKNQACIPLGGGGRIPELAIWVGDHPGLCKFLAGGVLALELTAPLVMLLRGVFRYLMLAAMASSALSFYFLVGADAWPIILVFFFFIPWEQLIAWARGRIAARGATP